MSESSKKLSKSDKKIEKWKKQQDVSPNIRFKIKKIVWTAAKKGENLEILEKWSEESVRKVQKLQ